MKILNGEDYLDGDEACRMLGIKLATLYAYVSRGIIKSYKQGIKRQRLYKRSELEALLVLRPGDMPDPVNEFSPNPPPKKSKKGQTEIPAAEDWIPYY